jgi:sulfur-oxidizing protein SoxY
MHSVDPQRRAALKNGASLSILGLFAAAGWITPAEAQTAAWDAKAFGAKGMDGTLSAMGATGAAKTNDINWGSTPQIAENGAVVPVSVESKIPKTESIAILVEKNPNTLTAAFVIPAGTDPNVSTRVKMGESSLVHALVKADGKYYVSSREIKVTLGGCGG